MPEELEELLEQLKNDETITATELPKELKECAVNDENVNDWVLDKASELVENGMDAVAALKEIILSSGEPTDIAAYSDVFKSVVGALDTITKINIQNKKARTAKELKEMDIKAKKELPAPVAGNTNVLIATRDDIFKNFIEEGKKTLEVTDDDIEDIEVVENEE